MIVDTSAVLAILRAEPDAEIYARAIVQSTVCRMSAGNVLESAIVIGGSRDPMASRRLDEFMRAAAIVVEPLTEVQVSVARAAYRDFGKGSGHPAKLNFGDCFAYALARAMDDPLLFKGAGFSRTDVPSAVRTSSE